VGERYPITQKVISSSPKTPGFVLSGYGLPIFWLYGVLFVAAHYPTHKPPPPTPPPPHPKNPHPPNPTPHGRHWAVLEATFNPGLIPLITSLPDGVSSNVFPVCLWMEGALRNTFF